MLFTRQIIPLRSWIQTQWPNRRFLWVVTRRVLCAGAGQWDMEILASDRRKVPGVSWVMRLHSADRTDKCFHMYDICSFVKRQNPRIRLGRKVCVWGGTTDLAMVPVKNGGFLTRYKFIVHGFKCPFYDYPRNIYSHSAIFSFIDVAVLRLCIVTKCECVYYFK